MGELFALLCALVWAVAVIFFKRSGETVPPFALNLFRVSLSSGLLVATMLVLGQTQLGSAPVRDYLQLLLSGIVGIAISDTFFHAALNRVGAGINAILDCLYAPLTALFAFLLLDEVLDITDIGGMVLVISAVLLASRLRPPAAVTRRALLVGIGFGILAMVTLALGVVLAKPVLVDHPVIWATGVRQVGALAVMLPVALVSPRRREHLSGLRPSRSWRFTVPGTVLGSYLALMLWLAGMKYTRTGAAAVLNQTATIYIIVLATLILKEPFSRRKAAACTLAVAGTALVIV